MSAGAGCGVSTKIARVTNVSGVPPPTGVAMIRNPGRSAPFAGAATAVTSPVFWTVAIVAISGSTASKTKVAGMIVPFCAVRAVAKSCVWNPGGRLVEDDDTSIQWISGVTTLTCTVAVFVMPLSVAEAVIPTVLAFAATPVTCPVASTVAIAALSDDQVIVAV